MNFLRFADPWWWCLVPLLAWLVLRRRRRPTITWSSTDLFRGAPRTATQRLRRALPALRLVALTLLVGAQARPQAGEEEFRVRTEGVDMMLCVDRSGSMRAMDFELDGRRQDRLTVVKRVVRDFVLGADGLPGRPDDRIGLVDFGGYVRCRCPLTLDHRLLAAQVDDVAIAEPVRDAQGRLLDRDFAVEEQATAIGDALARAVDRLRRSTAKSRIAILLSDGENTAGAIEPAQAAELAKAEGVKVYTIGIGSTGMAPVAVSDAFGRTQLQSMEVHLDEKTLKDIAATTGGEYFSAKDTDALTAVYATIDSLEKTELEGQVYRRYRELYLYALVPGALLLLLERLLSLTRFRTLP